MKRINLFLIALSATFMIYSCKGNNSAGGGSADTMATGTNAGDTMASSDSATMVSNPADTAANSMTTFALEAGSGGMMEVELGKMAQQNGQSARVKNFGAMMVRDHSQANKELMAIAAKKNINIPTRMDEKHQQNVDDLKSLKGADFDKKYMDMMVDDHKEDVDKFEKAAKNLSDPDLKSFASKTLPILQTHLDSAKAVKGDLK